MVARRCNLSVLHERVTSVVYFGCARRFNRNNKKSSNPMSNPHRCVCNNSSEERRQRPQNPTKNKTKLTTCAKHNTEPKQDKKRWSIVKRRTVCPFGIAITSLFVCCLGCTVFFGVLRLCEFPQRNSCSDATTRWIPVNGQLCGKTCTDMYILYDMFCRPDILEP